MSDTSSQTPTPPWLAKLNSAPQSQPSPFPSQSPVVQSEIEFTPEEVSLAEAPWSYPTPNPEPIPAQPIPQPQPNVVIESEPTMDTPPKSRLDILKSSSSGAGVDLRDFLTKGIARQVSVETIPAAVETDTEEMETDVPTVTDGYVPVANVPLPIIVPEVAAVVEPDPLPELGLAAHPATMTPESTFSALVAMLAQSNPDEAALIEGLRLYESQYVGVIVTVEQAIDHIHKCREDGVPIGRNIPTLDDANVKHRMYIEKRFRPFKLKKKVVEEKRLAWKGAIEQRKAAIAGWDSYVKTLHEEYNRVRDLPADYFEAVEAPEQSPLQP